MHIQVVQLVTFIIAFTLAASRILNATKAFWSLMPPVVAGIAPSLVVAVPALGQLVVGAQTWTDLAVAFLTAGALLLPGTHSHTVQVNKPNGPGSTIAGAAGLMIAIAFSALSLQGCAWFKGSFWPNVEHCAPTPAALASEVAQILAAGGDYESALEQAGLKEGKDAVECAVIAFTNSLGGPEGENSAAKLRGRSFLAKVKAGQ